jgi:hypothetical protein
MKYRFTALALVAIVIFTVACASSINRYYPQTSSPRMVYFYDQVEGLKTDKDLIDGNRVYTEIRTKEGDKKTGMLIRLTEDELVLNDGYYYSKVNDSLERFESHQVIPKEEILILRVW